MNTKEKTRNQEILSAYRDATIETYLRYGPAACLILIAGALYFVYEDLWVNGLPAAALVFRLMPVLSGFLFLAALITALRRSRSLVLSLYYLSQFSIMAMMAGLVCITAPTPLYETYVMGTTVCIFVVYLCNLFGMKALVLIYGTTLSATVLYLSLWSALPAGKIIIFSNPVATALVCCMLAQVQNNSRLREFRAGKTIETQGALLANELAIARTVHRNLLPRGNPSVRGAQIAALYAPMIEIGGDFYDFLEYREEGKLGIFICDVSGHGVSAALIASMVKAHLTTLKNLELSPCFIMEYLNRRLTGQTSGHFVTAFYGLYDAASRVLTYSRGGHNYPLLVRGGSFTELRVGGGLLGRIPDMKFAEAEMRLAPGDRLLFYTDGLIEARSPGGAFFGEAGLMRCTSMCGNQRAEDLIGGLCRAVTEFQGKDTFEDDVCVICMDIMPA